MGPIPSPITKRLSPSVATSGEQWNSTVICGYVNVYIDEVQVLQKHQRTLSKACGMAPAYTQAELNDTIHTTSHFLALLMLRGCMRSFSPSQCTSYSAFGRRSRSSECLSSSPKYLKPYPSPNVRELFGTLPVFETEFKPRPAGSRAASPLALDS